MKSLSLLTGMTVAFIISQESILHTHAETMVLGELSFGSN